MRKGSLMLFCVSMLPLLTLAHAGKGVPSGEEIKRTGVLMVAFGSTAPEAEAAYDSLDRMARVSMPGIPIRWAYTSSVVREKVARMGRYLDSPEQALAKMQQEGFTHVAVQSLLVIPGKEFHDLTRIVQSFSQQGFFEQIRMGAPLLGDQKGMETVVAAIGSILPGERQKKEAVLFMGHGTSHPANAFYTALMFQVQQKDPLVFFGCVAGYPDLKEIMAMLKAKKVRKVYLIPFMAVAGEHARRDMAGDGERSWKSVLTGSGFQCVPVLKGIAEFDAFAAIWVNHTKDLVDQLGTDARTRRTQ